MGQVKSKKGEVGAQSTAAAASNEALEFVKNNYATFFEGSEGKEIKTFDEFYHAIFEMIEKFSLDKGSMQFKIPSKDKLEKAFKANHPNDKKNLTKEEFEKIITSVIGFDSFFIGQGARDPLLFIFGAPVLTLLVKRFIPGLRSISDDIVIPAATSGSVIILAMTNKL
ncbi:uncharacterized protein LOC109709368 [Ananas comosus]|uniref:Uncharacterized protein LOC109709368 n=2 Tax=Ananas comosus TaxID=4615 RepID=A0A6P5EUJ9_ANACO|nr:uncharacterized protein LOC109709368 [Ananas comosus]